MTVESENPGILWGYILETEGRPDLARQRECIELHGVDLGEAGPWWHDTFKGRTTRPRGVLERREDLLNALSPGDTVVVAAPECLGLSEADAGWFLAELAAKGVRAIINGGSIVVQPGDDTTELTDAVRRNQTALHMRRHRSR